MLLLSFLYLINADESTTRRLARRRTDELDGKMCDLVDYVWREDWQAASGWMDFSVDEETAGFLYGMKVTDGSDLTSISWWDGEVGSTPAEQTAPDGSTMWVLDPRDDWFDMKTSFSHYMEFAGGLVPGDSLDLYYCYDPPTPEPTSSPTDEPAFRIYWNPPANDGDRRRDGDMETHDLAGTVINLVGFLAQSSWESAEFTACDENNHTGYSAKNPNPATGRPAECSQREAVGDDMYHQITQSEHSCKIKYDMHMKAQTRASWTSGYMECKPNPTTPITCTQEQLDDGSCVLYGPQPDADGYVYGLSPTAGCCWWGRGAIQTTGPGNYGDLQHDVISKREGNTLDLCENPEALCEEEDLKWLAGIYFWVAQVQTKSCFNTALEEYLLNKNSDAHHEASADCKNFAVGIGGAVNNGGWNSHAHGEEGRIGRFDTMMAGVWTALDNYEKGTIPAKDYVVPTCTGNLAVDTILDASDLETVGKINDLVGDEMQGKDPSVYTWAGLCDALKEFID